MSDSCSRTYPQEAHTRKTWDEGYILVDFDRTLAHYESWTKNGPTLGRPIPAMVERVKRWLAAGREVKVFTARAAESNPRRAEDVLAIGAWCKEHIGAELPVTNQKDFKCAAIWDDIAVTVESNTGWRLSVSKEHEPLTFEEETRLSAYATDTTSPRPTDKYTEIILVDGVPEGFVPEQDLPLGEESL